ncbi:hypothetical protein Gorai_002171 [Gossypium raimondii]|uniref:pyruvate decarboxylase n=1 Tax=Gossypium raimondii TaxID=29730 RepID=A0A7J8QL21_GOSRA|nr:hypothetical protein [Gossypium raimondii]
MFRVELRIVAKLKPQKSDLSHYCFWFDCMEHLVFIDQAVANYLEYAHELIDTAISTALKASKPVNISISCNLPAIPHPTFGSDPVRFTLSPKYEFHMQHGSIGWSVGATLGDAQAVPEKREIACISDGSFQVTAQDVPVMLRCGQKSIIFLINNGGYTIEVEIHDRPYHVIKNLNYTGLVEAIHNKGKCWTAKVCCEEELIKAIERATGAMKDCLCFIEVIVHKDDTSKELLECGCRVAATNGRPPYPQYSLLQLQCLQHGNTNIYLHI